MTDTAHTARRLPGLPLLVALIAVAAAAGCERNEWPEAPAELPGWIFDAPYYYQPGPQEELAGEVSEHDGQVVHYYTRRTTVLIRRPEGSDAAVRPRLAVYWTADNGYNWQRAGFFGIDQPAFTFVAPGPGDYGIRFVGPGIEPALLSQNPPPHRVYHVDTSPPTIIVQVAPAKEVYRVGEQITVSWTVSDEYIDPAAKVALYDVAFPAEPRMLADGFSLNGSQTVLVPEAARAGGVQFLVAAQDKAGNRTSGYSLLVRAAQSPPPAAQPDTDARSELYRPPPSPQPAPPPAAPQPAPRPAAPTAQPPAAPTQPPPARQTPLVPPPPMPDVEPDQIVRPPAPVPPPATQPESAAPAAPDRAEMADRALEPPGYRPRLYPTQDAHLPER